MKLKIYPKYTLRQIKKIKTWIILAGLFLLLFSLNMIVKTVNYKETEIAQEVYFKENKISPDATIVNSTTYDSVNHWSIQSRVVFHNPRRYTAAKPETVSIDLYNPQYEHLPLVFTAYYSIQSILILLIFTYMYLFVDRFQEENPFDYFNLKKLAWVGHFLSALAFFNIFGKQTVELVLNYSYGLNLELQSFNYENVLFIFFLGLTGMLIQLLVKTAIKGVEIKTEQDLTV